MAPQLGVLADDLTGAVIVAAMLERDGIVCPVVTDAGELSRLPADAPAVVVARKIRLVEPSVARDEARVVAGALRAIGVPRVYSKYSGLFDATRRGNIGPIAEELLDSFGAERTVFCPAYVERGLTVYQGHLFVRGTPLDRSFKRHDPATPAWTADLTESLRSQSPGVEVGVLPHQVVATGRDGVLAAVARRPSTRFFVADAVDVADVEHLAAAVADWPVVTGADSLAPALARVVCGDSRPVVAAPTPAAGRTAVLAGSCAEPTRRQLDALAVQHPVRRVRLAEEGDHAGLVDELAAWAAERLADGPVAIATSADPDDVRAAHERYGVDGASARADALLAGLATRLHASGVRRFVVAGGETSGAVLAALDVRQLRVAPFDDLAGGHCHRPGADPLSFVLKPGSVGDDGFLLHALARLDDAGRTALTHP